jgi:hypothetical protein
MTYGSPFDTEYAEASAWYAIWGHSAVRFIRAPAIVGLTGRHAAPKYWWVQNVFARPVDVTPRSMAARAVQDRSSFKVPGVTKAPAWKMRRRAGAITRFATAEVRSSHSGTYFSMDHVVVLRSTGNTILVSAWRQSSLQNCSPSNSFPTSVAKRSSPMSL